MMWNRGKGGKGGGKGGMPPFGKGNVNRRHYIQCQTIGCNGHVFQQAGTTMPDKCKTCNFCGSRFVIVLEPRQQKGDGKGAANTKGGNPISPRPKKVVTFAPPPMAAAVVAANKITAFYENLLEHGYSEEAALDQLSTLGLNLPKKIAPKVVDDYSRLITINRDIKQYQNDVDGQSEKYYRLAQSADELLDTIQAKQSKLAELKAEQLALHQTISKAAPEEHDHDKSSLTAVLQAELDRLSVQNAFIGGQPNVPDQVKELCARVEYVKGLIHKTFQSQFEATDTFEFSTGQQDITSEDLQQVGEEGVDDDVWPDGFVICDLDQEMEGSTLPEGLATASVVSMGSAGKGITPLPPSNCETEYPSYNMASWPLIKKKANGLDMPRPKVSKLAAAPANSNVKPRTEAASSSSSAAPAIAI